MLEGVELYPGAADEHGRLSYTQADGSRIVMDQDLGVFFKDGDADEGVI